MALINPTGATAAYHTATAIDRIVCAGTQIWAKPVTAPASIFSLTTAQAGKSGFNVTEATDASASPHSPKTKSSAIPRDRRSFQAGSGPKGRSAHVIPCRDLAQRDAA